MCFLFACEKFYQRILAPRRLLHTLYDPRTIVSPMLVETLLIATSSRTTRLVVHLSPQRPKTEQPADFSNGIRLDTRARPRTYFAYSIAELSIPRTISPERGAYCTFE